MFFQPFRLELLFSVNSLKENTFFFWHVCAPIIGPTLCLHYLSLSDPFVFLLVNDEGVTHDWRESQRLKTTSPVYFPHLSRNIEFINNGANHTAGARQFTSAIAAGRSRPHNERWAISVYFLKSRKTSAGFCWHVQLLHMRKFGWNPKTTSFRDRVRSRLLRWSLSSHGRDEPFYYWGGKISAPVLLPLIARSLETN